VVSLLTSCYLVFGEPADQPVLELETLFTSNLTQQLEDNQLNRSAEEYSDIGQVRFLPGTTQNMEVQERKA
jgi:hypothetical protein